MGSRIRRGENLRCKVEVRNFSKSLVNATAIDLSIVDPDGTEVAAKTLADISWESLGIYYYDYLAADDAVYGTYTAKWDVTYSGLHRISHGYFNVIE